MKLGISYTPRHDTPEQWAQALVELGCTAAVCPINGFADDAEIDAYRAAAQAHGIVIAEVGVWNSPVAADPAVRAKALDYAKRQLRLADKIGATCCVNVAGSAGPTWYLGDKRDITPQGYENIVRSVQEIIDDVQPENTVYTLECMAIVPPTSPDAYLQLIKDIDRPQFSVHLDPFNMVFTAQRYYYNADFFKEVFRKLGPLAKSIHAKDIILTNDLPFSIHEAFIGQGNIDYATFLTEIGKLSPDIPVIIEHRNSLEEYIEELAIVKNMARELGVSLR